MLFPYICLSNFGTIQDVSYTKIEWIDLVPPRYLIQNDDFRIDGGIGDNPTKCPMPQDAFYAGSSF